MEIVVNLWGFFITTHEWFMSLWGGWFAFFQSIIPWYVGLGLISKVVISIVYVFIGEILIERIGGIMSIGSSRAQSPIFRSMFNWTERIFTVLMMPAIVILAIMIVIPIMPGFIFYGLWFIVWFAVAMIGLMVLVFAWPISLIF